jgi:hypothetical protein
MIQPQRMNDVLHGMFRAGLPWILVLLLVVGNLILSQTSALLR